MPGCANTAFPTLLADQIAQALCALHEATPSTATANPSTLGNANGDTTPMGHLPGGGGGGGGATPAAKRHRSCSDGILQTHSQQQQEQQCSRSSDRLPPSLMSAVRRRFERELFPVYLFRNGWRHVVPYTARRYTRMQCCLILIYADSSMLHQLTTNCRLTTALVSAAESPGSRFVLRFVAYGRRTTRAKARHEVSQPAASAISQQRF